MEQENLFFRFLVLIQLFFREKREIEFYADELNMSVENLQALIAEASDIGFEDWIAISEKAWA